MSIRIPLSSFWYSSFIKSQSFNNSSKESSLIYKTHFTEFYYDIFKNYTKFHLSNQINPAIQSSSFTKYELELYRLVLCVFKIITLELGS